MPFFTQGIVYATLASTLLSLSALAQVRSTSPPPPPNPRQADSLRRLYQVEHYRRILDPALGRVPLDRLDAIREQLISTNSQRQARTSASTATWTERGPVGFTGVLTALLTDPTGRELWAGSATGGLWSNTNVNNPATEWTCVSDAWESKNVSALASDPTNTSLIYAATGTANSEIIGGGIWKSADAGRTWLRLTTTVPAQSGTLLQTAFGHIAALAVTGTGVLLAGTQGGVLRSSDQGQTWQFVLAPQQQIGGTALNGGNDRISTIRVEQNGSIYTALATGRLFRSTTSDGTGWTEITPPNAVSSVSLRTEIAVSTPTSSTAQVLYAAQIAPDASSGGKTLRWLMRSINSGQTWQVMNRPVYPDAPDLDITLGFGDHYFTLTTPPDSASTVYLTAYDRLYRSGDGGISWSVGQAIGRTTTLLPLPGGQLVWGSDNRLYVALAQPLVAQGRDEVLHNRSNRFGALDVAGVALKNEAGSPYRLTGSVTEPGLLESSDSGAGSTQAIYPAYPLRPFIDQNEPDIQVAMTTNGGFLTRNLGTSPAWDYYSSAWGSGDYPDGGVAYDSQSNTLFFWSDKYMKATGIGGEPIVSPLSSNTLARPTCLKTGVASNTLFAGTLGGRLYKLTQTNQPTPVVTQLDANAFPAGSTISSIDVGVTDNELLITLSNYGVQSVWYTADGGATWLSKDLPAHGLPDFPVYAALMNPANYRQVMLATELGVWSTTDITAANPGWVLSNTNAPLIRAKNLVYRVADGHIALVTAGRGVWETNAWTLNPPTLIAGPMAATALCTGSTFPLSFTLTNAPASRVALRLSSATGNFTDGPVIAAIRGTSGVLSGTLPTTLASGMGYRLRLEATDLNLTTIISNTLTISNLTSETGRILDRRQTLSSQLADARYVTGYVCPGDSALLRAYVPNQPNSPTITYRWAIDGQPITGQTTVTLLTGQTGTYSFTASVGSCTTINTNDFLLIATNSPALSVLNPANADEGPVCPGTSLSLVSSYLGQRAVYQWFRDGNKLLSTASPVFSATQTGSYSYSLTVTATNAAGVCTATAPATYLTFSPVILPATIAVAGDAPPTTCGTELLTLYATRQPANTTYQWLLNGHLLAGKTSSFINVSQGGVYRLQSGRGTCRAVSDPISVSANSLLSNGVYFYGSTTLCAGESLVLYAKNITHALQWTKNNVSIDGATGFNYVVTEPGNYGLRYVSGSCSGTSVTISVVFGQTLTPVLSLAEQCTTVDLLTRDFPRTGTVSFSWFRNGQPISQGLQAYQSVTESGLYSVSVTNGVCGGLSAPVDVRIGQPAKPVIAAVGGLVSCANSAVVLQRISGSYSYWRRNGIRLNEGSSDQLVATQTGVYSLVYAQGTCLTESAAVSVVIGQPASATLVSRAFIRSGQSAVLPIQLSGEGPWSFSMVGGAAVVNTFQNPYSLTVTPSQTTSYSFVGITNSCGVGPESVLRVFVDGADVSLTGWVNKRFAQPGDSVTYSVRITNAGPDVAENLTVLNRLPTGLSYGGSLSATTDNTLRHVVGNVPVGESREFNFRTKINRPGTYLNAVEVIYCDTPDPDSQANTGTTDGEDDAAWVDYRTADSTGYVASSPNPNGRILPAVSSNQPTPVAEKADLSLSIFLNKRVAQLRDTIRVTVAVNNRGGLAAAQVQTGLTLPNGTYSLDRITWQAVVPTLTVEVGQVEPNATISRIVYWLPTASTSCRAEVTRSSIADPDSTPNNRSTRPGEDDEATVDVRVLR